MSPTQSIEKSKYSPDMDEATIRLFEFVQPYTMTGIARVAALRQAVQYVAKNQIPGAIAECGVWKGGIIIIDDYGHWQGARQAVDQYIAEHNLKLLLNRIDYTARICVKIEG